MNSLLDNTDDEEEHASRGPDREITLGTTMILLIFFALAVYGAVLFGFGYSLGSKHSTDTVAAVPVIASSGGGQKPAPGSPVGSHAAEIPPETVTVPYTPPKTVPTPAPIERPAAEPDSQAEDIARATPPRTPPSATTATPASAASASTSSPVATAGGSIVVQVAALSHQEDAEMIAKSLRARGYAVNIRPEADKLLHVQVGPFATRKDADTIKAKLLADGFNAYIK